MLLLLSRRHAGFAFERGVLVLAVALECLFGELLARQPLAPADAGGRWWSAVVRWWSVVVGGGRRGRSVGMT